MDTFDYRKRTQDRVLLELKKIDFKDPDWHKPITQLDYSIVIWFLKELVEKPEYREYLDKIFALAKIYAESSDPSPDEDKINERIEKGEEIRNIYTERGTACWLLSSIAATFRTEFYPEIISILEKLASDPVYYVRIQTTVPLSFFAVNIRARQHKDGTSFDFKDTDRARVIDLSFRMLQEHRDLPRVLEGVVNVFNVLRSISESQARQVIEYFFYNSKNEIQPEYLTRQGVPLLLFFAEYRVNLNDGFDGGWFQDFALELLKLPEEKAPYLRSTFIWHVWKEIQNDRENFSKLKKYIPLFLHDDFELQSLHQYEFLVKEVIKISPKEGLDLFKRQLNFVTKWAHKYSMRDHSPWLLDVKEIIERIAPDFPDEYLEILRQITQIISQKMYVGDELAIFRAYTLIPDLERRGSIKPEVLRLYQEVRQLDRFEKLPEEL